jgi:ADP-heptose:LPS heptosyltransferase
VIALPCFHLIARVYPNAERRLLTNFPVHSKAPAAAAVLGDSGLVHGYMRYTMATRRIGELLRLAWKIRRFSPDVLIYLLEARPIKNVYRDRLFFRLAGVRRVLGLPGEEELKARFDPATGLYESEALRLARVIAELGDAHPEEIANWDLRLNAAEREAATRALPGLAGKKLIVCGPGTKMQAKDWGQDNWRALLSLLSVRYPHHGLVLVGSREEAQIGDHAAQGWTGPKVNLCGMLTPRETTAVLEYAAVFLGPDSGPMHLAASVGVPCVIAFSAAGLPGAWFPAGQQHQIVYHQTSCYGCQLETCIVEARRCLTSIRVAEMAEAVARVLDKQVV